MRESLMRPRFLSRFWSVMGLVCGFLVVSVMLSGCQKRVAPEVSQSSFALHGRAMGTSWSVLAQAENDESKDVLQKEIEVLLESVEDRFSHWRQFSEISRFNQSPAETMIPVTGEMLRLIRFGEEMRVASEGAFDIRVARRVAQRGFGPESLVRREGVQDFGHLQIGADPASLTKKGGAFAVDLSAFVKGYAVDRIGALCAKNGIVNYLVEVGGELKASGQNAEGELWGVGVEVPAPRGASLNFAVRLQDESIATSGNYRLFKKTSEGGIHSHLVDPRHADSSEVMFRSVSVIHPEAMVADAWATALFVLGEEGMKKAQELNLSSCFLRLAPSGEVVRHMTGDFEESLSR